MDIKIFDSDWDATDYCYFNPHEVVYSSESNCFYFGILEGNEYYEGYRACSSSVGSSEFYSEANFIFNDLTKYLEVTNVKDF